MKLRFTAKKYLALLMSFAMLCVSIPMNIVAFAAEQHITISNLNNATVAENGSVTLNFNVSSDIAISGGIHLSAVSSDTTILDNPVPINSNGNVSMVLQPKEYRSGYVDITVTATGDIYTTSKTIRLTITPMGYTNDSVSTNINTPLKISVLTNDYLVWGNSLNITQVISPLHGTAVKNADNTITYTPNAGFTGMDTFIYYFHNDSDGEGGGTVSVFVAQAEVPVANDDERVISEDVSQNIDILSNDTHPNGDTISVTGTTAPLHGTVVLYPDYTINYTPSANWHGTDTFTYTISNGSGGTDTATVTITVYPVNDAPNAIEDAITINQGQSVTFDVRTNDTDVDGDSISINNVSTPLHGMSSLTSNGIYYTPNANWYGTETLTYTITDYHGGTDTATFTITVLSTLNLVNDTAMTNINTAVDIPVLSNDTNTLGYTLFIGNITTSPLHGTAIINEDKTIKYTPSTNWHGADTFKYLVYDGHSSAEATVTVMVNNAPVATDDTASTNEDTLTSINVIANDTDPNGDALSVTITTPPTHGTTVVNDDKTISYTPSANWNGIDTFTYTISDGNGGTDTATVSVTVNPINDIPIAADDTATTVEETSVYISVLSNDTDSDGDTLKVIGTSIPIHGTLTINDDGTINYMPNVNYNGTDTFSYLVSDGKGNTDTATVTITIASKCWPPIALDDIAGGKDKNTQYTINVLDNDIGDEGYTITITNITNPTNGTAVLNGDKTITYTPNTDWSGTDTFTYTISDGNDGTSTATVTVKIDTDNHIPVAVNDSITIDENTFGNLEVRDNDTDADGDTLIITGVSVPAHGTAEIVGGHWIKYIPNKYWYGTDTFTYTISDDKGGIVTATATATVDHVTVSPKSTNDYVAADQNIPITIDVFGNDYIAQGEILTIVATTAPNHGTIIVNADNTITYTPEMYYYGLDSFYYTISDTNGVTAQAEVGISIAMLQPEEQSDILTTNEDTSANINIITYDYGVNCNVSVSAAPVHGTAVKNDDNTITYTPDPDYYGSDSFKYSIVDIGHGTGITQVTVNVTVDTVNDGPDAVNDTVTTNEGAQVNITVLSNDTDVETDTLSVIGTTTPSHGTVVIEADNTITYTPNADYNGEDNFTYTISDGNEGEDIATVTVTVAPTTTVNYDANGGDGSMTGSSAAAGTVIALSVNTYTRTGYTFNGWNTAADGSGASYVGGASYTMPAGDGTLYAQWTGATQALQYDYNGGSGAMANSTAPTGNAIALRTNTFTKPFNTFTGWNTKADGSGTSYADGVSYTMPVGGGTLYAQWTGTSGLSNIKMTLVADKTVVDQGDTVNITMRLTGTNNLGSIDGSVIRAVGTVLKYDYNNFTAPTDAGDYATGSVIRGLENSISTFESYVVPYNSTNGQLWYGGLISQADGWTNTTGGPDNSIDIITIKFTVPMAATVGDYTFSMNEVNTYLSTNNLSEYYEATTPVTVTVDPVNDVPDAVNDSITTNEDAQVKIAILANDTDAEADTLTVISTTTPLHGTVAIEADNEITYTPNADYNGTDTFTYTISDGNGGEDTATVTVTISPLYDPPIANNSSILTTRNIAVHGVANGSDVDGDSLNFIIDTVPQHGNITLNLNGTYTYTPDSRYIGTDSFTFKCNDASVDSNIATITITINPTPTTQNVSPIINIDAPSNGAYMTKQMYIAGWAINRSDVKNVDIYMDNNYLGAAVVGEDRSDVDVAYPSIPKSNISTFAFATNLNLSSYSIGNHLLTVTSTGYDGTTTTQTINITNIPPIISNDAPASYSTDAYTSIPVFGWTIAPDGIKSVAINIDGSSDSSLSTIIEGSSLNSRPDVQNAYSFYPGISLNEKSGFYASFDINKISAGIHKANITITTNDGTIVTSSKSFTLIKANSYLTIDSPVNGSYMNGNLEIAGWAIDPSRVKSIDVYLAGKNLGSATIGGTRSDVAAVYHTYSTNQISTFTFASKLDLSDYAFQSYPLTVTSTGYDGTTTTQTINITNVAPIISNDAPASYSTDAYTSIPVYGWAIAPDGIKSVAINIDGSSDSSLSTIIDGSSLNSRPDVQNAYSFYPGISLNENSSFYTSFDINKISAGTHKANITITTNDGTIVTSSKSFTLIKANSYLTIDSPVNGSYMNGNLEIAGWAIDPSRVKSIDVYLAGKNLGSATIGGTRSDVAAVYHTYSTNQISTFTFASKLDLSEYAFQSYPLTATSTGYDGTTTTQTINITNVAPIISNDSPDNYSSETSSIPVYGWAIASDGIKNIAINIDGSSDSSLSTTIEGSSLSSRQDVQNAYSYYPGISLNEKSGFYASFDINKISAGIHKANITITTNDGTIVTSSKSFTLIKANSYLTIDSPVNGSYMNGNLEIAGWAIDPSRVKSIDVYLAGKNLGSATIGGTRSDVAAVYHTYSTNQISTFTFASKLDLSDYAFQSYPLTVTSTGYDGTTTTQTINITNVAPIISNDAPASYSTDAYTSIPVYGWAIAPDGIKSVAINIDGSSDSSLSTIIDGSSLNSRPDVQNAYSFYPGISLNENSSFYTSFDINKISAGTHKANITITTNDGTIVTSSKSFTLIKANSYLTIDSPVNGSYMNGNLEIAGWAIDPSRVKSIDVYLAGKNLGSATIGGTRSDVAAVYHTYSTNQISTFTFASKLDLSEYAFQSYPLTATSTGYDGTTTTQTINITNVAPIISNDSPDNYSSETSSIPVYGWAIAPDGIKNIAINIDGSSDSSLSTTIEGSSLSSRQDVQNAYSYYPGISLNEKSGFYASFDINKISAGIHTVNITIITNDNNTLTKKYAFNVTKLSSVLCIDTPTSGKYISSNMNIAGWAINDSTIQSVDIYIDGSKVSSASLESSRADVCAAYPNYSKSDISSYSANLNLNLANYTVGNHTMTVVATGLDVSSASQSLTINKPAPILCVDSPVASSPYHFYGNGSSINVSGWALNASSIASISIAIDGISQDILMSINNSSDDVNGVYPEYPFAKNARFNGTISTSSLTDGIHIIKVTATGTDGVSQTTEIAVVYGSLTSTTSYNISLSSMLLYQQQTNTAVTSSNIDPTTINQLNRYEFLDLTYYSSNITAAQLDVVLQNRGVLAGHGADFITAANTYKINPLYLIAHARLETGNGTSTLATGQVYSGDGITYYNMFGIGAFDNIADSAGLAAAHKYEWYSVSKAIIGGAGWIAKNYVNSIAINSGDGKQHYDQDTLYEMRWDPYATSLGKSPYRYATDPAWAYKIARIMFNDYGSLMTNSNMTFMFDIPAYSN